MGHANETEGLKREVIAAAAKYFAVKKREEKAYAPGDRIHYAGRVYDEKEISYLVDAALDFWLTAGTYAGQFEKKLGEYLGTRYCSLTNSGSSANLLAFMALTSPRLGGRAINRGDEVITVAAGFPTTVAPVVQFGAVPVFVDICLPSCGIDCSKLEDALSERTKAVMLAHTLGNPFDLERVKDFCDRHGLWLVEDNCDALGSRYFFRGEWRRTGSIGHLGTSSFYPPHHITTGEGGAVYTDHPELKQIVDSFRDWGRDCRCPSGHDNTCRKRFCQQRGDLPAGYDHKYIYSHFGYNLKITDLQAAVGCAQLDKLPGFIECRSRNWSILRSGLGDTADCFILPEAAANSIPSWFGFLLIVKESAGFTRDEIVRCLEESGIQTRMLFAGNLLRQPCFDEMRKSGRGYRVAGDLVNTDLLMNRAFWLGVYPGITEEKACFMVARIKGFIKKKHGA
ncbi:lipopolysaccharide biosynthesis protein RfbH [Pelotomaculum propionicicum]|uniref:lipopolysaccharide biosynthesis protein RfbH n=1 Tax=Pelotomaculum propionicicum TaxID=258475 RepID=UPI003B796153